MGGCGSTLSDGNRDNRGPRPVKGPLKIPTVIWHKVESWEHFYARSTPNGCGSEESQFSLVRDWLASEYPECDKEGTIEDLGEATVIPTSYGPCKYKGKQFLTLDSNYTGVTYALTLVLALPATAGEEHINMEPGAMLNTPEMDAAKDVAVRMMAMTEQAGTNVDHCDAHVIIGADMLRCKFKCGYQQPTITPLHEQNAEQIAAIHDRIAQEVHNDPEARVTLAGKFLPMHFRNAIKVLTGRHGGCTVWDGGEFPFGFGEERSDLPARLLVVRRFASTADEIAATHYRVLTPDTTPNEDPVTIVRGIRPDVAFDGAVVRVLLYVATPSDAIWPTTGDYAKKPTMTAAVMTLLEHLKKLNKQGKIQRCMVEVEMGADRLRLSFVGDRIEPQGANSTMEAKASKDYTSLDGFSVRLEEQRKHELFESESQFQAIKQMMHERAQQDPSRFAGRAPMIAQMAANHFLEMNYPGCAISDEGEMPVTIEGQTITIPDTRLVIGKDPVKSHQNVIAALMLVPLPEQGSWIASTEKSWLDTKEMAEAETALLTVLKQWYIENKIATDCMAQVMMGTDVTIYRFVDGQRFEDYDEERMKQFQWG